MDIVNKECRSRMMSGIKGKNTKPEMIIRSLLHKDGFRYRIHVKDLPGKPDIVLRKYRAVIFVHGCFWHRHDCRYFKWPKTRADFWKKKLNGNVENDKRNIEKLLDMKWRICIIWECSIRGAQKDVNEAINEVIRWLKSDDIFLEVGA